MPAGNFMLQGEGYSLCLRILHGYSVSCHYCTRCALFPCKWHTTLTNSKCKLSATSSSPSLLNHNRHECSIFVRGLDRVLKLTDDDWTNGKICCEYIPPHYLHANTMVLLLTLFIRIVFHQREQNNLKQWTGTYSYSVVT